MQPEAFQPKIVAFCCHYCAYSSADLAGSMRIQYPPNVRIIRTPCTGRLETEYFIEGLGTRRGRRAGRRLPRRRLHFVEGNLCAKRRVNYTGTSCWKSPRKRPHPHGQHFRRHGPAAGGYDCRYGPNHSKTGPEPHPTQWFAQTGELLMIVAQRKNIPDLLAIVEKHRKLLVLGCGTCVTVCLAGGQREVSIIASALRMAAKLKASHSKSVKPPSNASATTSSSNKPPIPSRTTTPSCPWVAAPASALAGALQRQTRLCRPRHRVHRHPRGTRSLGGKMWRLWLLCAPPLRRRMPRHTLCQTHAQWPVQRLP